MEGLERRKAARHRVSFRLVFDDGGGFCMGTVVDISASGVLLRVDDAVEVGALVALHPVGAAGEILFDVKARVVRVAERAGGRHDIGLEFTSVDQRRLTALRRIFREMPATEDVELDPPQPEFPDDRPTRELPHHRIRARLTATSTKQPRWARQPLS